MDGSDLLPPNFSISLVTAIQCCKFQFNSLSFNSLFVIIFSFPVTLPWTRRIDAKYSLYKPLSFFQTRRARKSQHDFIRNSRCHSTSSLHEHSPYQFAPLMIVVAVAEIRLNLPHGRRVTLKKIKRKSTLANFSRANNTTGRYA